MAVDPLLVTRLREGGFPSRDKLRKGIFLLERCCSGDAAFRLVGENGPSSITGKC
jgi:hypothetical protein